MAAFQNDEFSGASLDPVWTVSTDVDVAVADGYVSLTTDVGGEIYQGNITGEFDIVARMKCAFYPSIIPDASYACRFFARVDSANGVYGYQNRKTGSETQNEAKIFTEIEDFPYGKNPALDPLSHICIRVKRDSSNDLYVYYNTADDGSGSWVEAEPASRLNTSAALQIGFVVAVPYLTEKTYQIDYVTSYGDIPLNLVTFSGSFTRNLATARSAIQSILSFVGSISNVFKDRSEELQPSTSSILSLLGGFYRNIVTRKTVQGALYLSGVGRRFSQFLTGGLTRSIQVTKTKSGQLDMTGRLIIEIILDFLGSLTPSGLYTRLLSVRRLKSGSISSSGLVTRARSWFKTKSGILNITGALGKKRLFPRLYSGVLSFAGTVAGVVARAFYEELRTGILSFAGIVRRGQNKETSGSIFGTSGETTDYSFDKTEPFEFEDDSGFDWSGDTSIGRVTKWLSLLRLMVGSITPSGILTRRINVARTVAGTYTPTGLIRSRIIQVAKANYGSLDFSGSQTTSSVWEFLYGTLTHVMSNRSRTPAGELSMSGFLDFVTIGIFLKLYEGTLTLTGEISRTFSVTKSYASILSLSGLSARVLGLLRTYSGTLTSEGVVSWVRAAREYLASGVLSFAGAASRSSILERAKQGVLDFAGNVLAAYGYLTFAEGTGELGIAGAVSRVISVTNLRSGVLTLAGVTSRGSGYAFYKTNEGSISFGGTDEGSREALYYGPELL